MKKVLISSLGISNPEDYISFYGMRNWDILMGTLVSVLLLWHIRSRLKRKKQLDLGEWNHLCSFQIDDCWWSNVYLWIGEYQWSISSWIKRFRILFSCSWSRNGGFNIEWTNTESRSLLFNMEKEIISVWFNHFIFSWGSLSFLFFLWIDNSSESKMMKSMLMIHVRSNSINIFVRQHERMLSSMKKFLIHFQPI